MGTSAHGRELPIPGSRLLRQAMNRRGLTQEQVSALVGCSQQTVSVWLRGTFVPNSAEQIVRLRDLLGIPPEAWLTSPQRRSLRRAVASDAVPAAA